MHRKEVVVKGTILAGLFYVFCAVSGCFAGFGICRVESTRETEPIEQNISTEDNTLVSKEENGVFFDEAIVGAVSPMPTVAVSPEPRQDATEEPVDAAVSATEEENMPIKTPVIAETPLITDVPLQEEEVTVSEGNILPSLGMLFAGGETAKLPEDGGNKTETTEQGQEPNETPEPQTTTDVDTLETPVLQTVTIPAKIFGQTPVLNPSDAYVSYFEFCYDLIARMEPKVQEKGMNMNVLLTKFALKALLCGVDVEKVDINAPIPRRQAALCLFLAAQVLNEKGTDTSQKSAEKYVADISDCSSPERKAIAYLYEQGIIKGYQVAGQKFYPSEGLKTKDGSEWLAGTVRCWK